MENQENEKKELTLVEKIDLILNNQEMIMKDMQEIKEKLKRKRNPNHEKTYVKIKAYLLEEKEKSIYLLNERRQGAYIAKSTLKKDKNGNDLYDPNKSDLQYFYIENWVVAKKFPLPQKQKGDKKNE